MCTKQGKQFSTIAMIGADCQRPLVRPVVLDPLGKLYNKDAIIEFFLDRSKYGDGDRICGYLKGVKVSPFLFSCQGSRTDV
jgi:hypothetical protein